MLQSRESLWVWVGVVEGICAKTDMALNTAVKTVLTFCGRSKASNSLWALWFCMGVNLAECHVFLLLLFISNQNTVYKLM